MLISSLIDYNLHFLMFAYYNLRRDINIILRFAHKSR